MMICAVAVSAFFIGLGVFLLKPLWFVPPNDDMYGNSVARVNGVSQGLSSGGDGECERVEGTGMLSCQVELDPGSGFGATLAVWKTEGNCWKAYRMVPKKYQQRSLASALGLPPNTYVRGPEIQGCIEFYKDVW